MDDAFIHIDLKTVQMDNLGDYNTNIFVGLNQNSYKGTMIVKDKDYKKIDEVRKYNPSLPYFYNRGKSTEKVCLTYFVTILYEKTDLDIYIISLMCMPNGFLEKIYGSLVLKAGKNIDKTRYEFSKADRFSLIDNKYRVMCINRNEEKIKSFKDNTHKKGIDKKLKYYLNLKVE